MFFLIGINAVDLLSAKAQNVKDGRLEYIRSKTNKRYSIKIEPEAQAILDKYHGKGYLLDAMDTCKNYQNFAHQMNDALKAIGTSVEEYEYVDDLFATPKKLTVFIPVVPDISIYFARHTWATTAYEIDIPMDVISQALGHAFGNRTTLIYVNFNQKKVDEANRKVIDYFFGKLS